MKKRILLTLAALILLLTLLPAAAYAATAAEEGTVYGFFYNQRSAEYEYAACQWTLDNEGVLTFSCDDYYGQIYGCYLGYREDGNALLSLDPNWPWLRADTRDTITKIVLGDSISGICPVSYRVYNDRLNPDVYEEVQVLPLSFRNLRGLKTLSLSTQVEEISGEVFSGCAALETVETASDVHFDKGAFKNCASLTSVTVGSVGEAVFQGCTGLETVILSDSDHDTSIGTECFSGCVSLREIAFPLRIVSIDLSAFDGCTGLESITFSSDPPALTGEGGALFGGCEARFYYPDTPAWQAERENNAAAYGNRLTWSAMDRFEGTLNALNWKFYYDTGLLEITGIGGMEYYGHLEQVDENGCPLEPDPFDPDVGRARVPWETFKNSITQVHIGNGVTTIGSDAFKDCVNLLTVDCPGSVTTIGGSAFEGCVSLMQIRLPDGILRIPNDMLHGCASLESVEIPATVQTIGISAFQGCAAMESVTIPDSVKTISMFAFSGTGLKTLELGRGVEVIDYGAFNDTSLTSVFIPGSVKTLGGRAFRTVSEATFEGANPGGSGIHGAFGVYQSSYPARLYDVTVHYPANDSSWVEAVAVDQTGWESRIIWSPYDVESESVDISRCSFTLEKRGYVYDGTEKMPGVTGIYGNTPLTLGTDYSLRYANNINAGSANVTIKGAGSYVGEVILNFEIARAEPKLVFESASLSKNPGDGAFTNKLTATTDGTVSYRSSDPAVATVNASTGRVTVVGAGTAIITASAAQGRNYAAGSTTFALTVARPVEPLTWEDLSFSFSNSRSAFGYANGYMIPLDRYEYIYEPLIAKAIYTKYRSEWGGSCFGFSSTSILMNGDNSDLLPGDYGRMLVHELGVSDYSSRHGVNVRQTLESLQVSWYQHDIGTYFNLNYMDMDRLCREVEQAEETHQYPVIALYWNNGKGGHAVVGYKLVHANDTTDYLYVYDPNYPYTTVSGSSMPGQIGFNSNRRITLKKQGGSYVSWYYKVNEGYSNAVNCGSNYSDCFFTHIPYAVMDNIWKNKGHNSSQYSNMLIVNSQNFEIYDYADNLVGFVQDGILTSYRSDIFAMMDIEEFSSDNTLIYLPTDTYRIVNNEGGVLNVGMVNLYQSAEVETTAPSVIISVADDAHMNQVQVEGVEGDQYLVTLCSELPGDEDISELQFSGQTSNAPMTVGVTDHALNLTNCPGVCMLVNGSLTAIPEQDTLKSITEYAPSLAYSACVYDGTAKTPEVRFGGEYELKQNVDYVVIYDQNTEIGQAQATVWGVGAYTGNVVLNFNIVATEQELCPNGHQWDEGTVTQKPSFTADGTVTYTCRVCGSQETEKLAGLYYYCVNRTDSNATVSLTNNTSAALNARICLVGYDENGKMTCLNMKTIALSGGDMTQLKLSFDGNAPAKIKAMLLDDARMMPIGSAWLVP